MKLKKLYLEQIVELKLIINIMFNKIKLNYLILNFTFEINVHTTLPDLNIPIISTRVI